MKITLYILLFLSFSIISCNRPNTDIHGKVLRECSNSPIAGVQVELWTGDQGSPNHQQQMETQTTSTDGSYDFHFHSSFLDENYWVQYNGVRSEYVKKREEKELNLIIPDISLVSYLDILIKNASPFDNHDSIFIDVVRPNSSSPTYHLQYSYKGSSVDTVQLITVNGCAPKLVNLKWAVTKNNITTNYSNSTTCTNSTTSQFSINY